MRGRDTACSRFLCISLIAVGLLGPLAVEGQTAARRIPSQYVCPLSGNSNEKEAREANNQYLDSATKKFVESKDLSAIHLTYEEKRAPVLINTAKLIDLAIGMRELHRQSQAGNFGIAYDKNQQTIERLAALNWKDSPDIQFLQPSLRQVAMARLVDIASVYQEACSSTRMGAFADACKENQQEIVAVAKKDWTTEKASDDELKAMARVEVAHDIDLAILLKGAARRPNSPAFLDAYSTYQKEVGQIAQKDWKKDQLQVGELLGLCKVLDTYLPSETPRTKK